MTHDWEDGGLDMDALVEYQALQIKELEKMNATLRNKLLKAEDGQDAVGGYILDIKSENNKLKDTLEAILREVLGLDTSLALGRIEFMVRHTLEEIASKGDDQ